MVTERSRSAHETVPESYRYLLALLVLLLVTALSFGTGRIWVGTAGVVVLCVLSLVYGALQLPDRLD